MTDQRTGQEIEVRPLFYVLLDAQKELHLSRSWRWAKSLLPERWFRHTKLALCDAIIAHALARTRPEGEPETVEQRQQDELLPRVMRVDCTQFASCGWHGKRMVLKLGVQPRPCPKCGKPVSA